MVSLVWVAVGYTVAFGDGLATSTGANPIVGGFERLFLVGISPETLWGDIPEYVWVLFQGMFSLIAVAIIAGGIVERMQVVRQLLSALFVVVFAAGMAFAIAKAMGLIGGSLRVSVHDEACGLDVSQHGESSYPAFSGMDLN